MKYLYIVFGVLISSAANADYSCVGNVTYLGTDNGLFVNNGYGVHNICQLNEDAQKDKCKSWLSMAMSAQAQNRGVEIFYADSTGKQSSEQVCNSIGDWVVPTDTVYFFRII